ncbi:hypothetical protein EDC01DRAFT_777834 [Geopyxis carbonaria]|nr:hypothetical protein EDC01DRAFT_777834 [Geopyxis carbonaria]
MAARKATPPAEAPPQLSPRSLHIAVRSQHDVLDAAQRLILDELAAAGIVRNATIDDGVRRALLRYRDQIELHHQDSLQQLPRTALKTAPGEPLRYPWDQTAPAGDVAAVQRAEAGWEPGLGRRAAVAGNMMMDIEMNDAGDAEEAAIANVPRKRPREGPDDPNADLHTFATAPPPPRTPAPEPEDDVFRRLIDAYNRRVALRRSRDVDLPLLSLGAPTAAQAAEPEPADAGNPDPVDDDADMDLEFALEPEHAAPHARFPSLPPDARLMRPPAVRAPSERRGPRVPRAPVNPETQRARAAARTTRENSLVGQPALRACTLCLSYHHPTYRCADVLDRNFEIGRLNNPEFVATALRIPLSAVGVQDPRKEMPREVDKWGGRSL